MRFSFCNMIRHAYRGKFLGGVVHEPKSATASRFGLDFNLKFCPKFERQQIVVFDVFQLTPFEWIQLAVCYRTSKLKLRDEHIFQANTCWLNLCGVFWLTWFFRESFESVKVILNDWSSFNLSIGRNRTIYIAIICFVIKFYYNITIYFNYWSLLRLLYTNMFIYSYVV